MNCTGSLMVHQVLMICGEEEGHLGDHCDIALGYRWPDGVVIGTCFLPPRGGTERVE